MLNLHCILQEVMKAISNEPNNNDIWIGYNKNWDINISFEYQDIEEREKEYSIVIYPVSNGHTNTGRGIVIL